MKMAFVPRLLIPILLCGTALEAAAQQPTQQPAQQQDSIPNYRFRLLGVYDERTGDPVAGAKVSDMESGTSSLTTITGTVSLVFLPDGASLVKVQKLGYEPKMMPVTISPSDTTPLTLVLQPFAARSDTRLPTVTTTAAAPYVSPALKGFQEREKTGATGYFIDDTTLRKSEGHQLANVMRSRMPSAIFHAGPGGSILLLQSPRCKIGGPPQVYLDGVPLASDPPPPSASGGSASGYRGAFYPQSANSSSPELAPFDLSKFQVSDLAGVEWYPSSDQAPIEYAGTSKRCGVLLLWTRER